MPSLSNMALVDLQDGKGARHIPGLVWSPVSHLWEASMTDPHGNNMFIGNFETPGQALQAIESMRETFARMKASTGIRVGGPRPA